MTFEEWWETFSRDSVDGDVDLLVRAAWEAAFDEGVKWTLQQDANTLNKLQLTLDECDERMG